MIQSCVRIFVAAAAIVLLSGVAHADPIVPNPPGGPWYDFQWSGVNTDATPFTGSHPPDTIAAPAAPWTFTGPHRLFVVDCCVRVDRFNIFDSGSLVGLTSVPGGGTASDLDPDVLWLDPLTSKGIFEFGGGSHSITIQAVTGSLSTGRGFFRLEAIPEPASLLLLGIGAAAAAGWRRRRRRA